MIDFSGKNTIHEVRGALKGALFAVAREEAASQAAIMLEAVTGMDELELLLRRGERLDPTKLAALERMARRRLSGEPLQYILGEWAFMGLKLIMRPCALIPRQDTETVAEAALMLAKERGFGTALDLCCGTGCIGISLAALGGLDVTMSDISGECVALARENAAMHGISAQFAEGDLFSALSGARFDLIVCNPPYIPSGDIESLQREVKNEPRRALDGGEDGLDFYRRISGEYQRHLNPGGALLLEIGFDQAEAVRGMFGGSRVIKDLGGNDRCVIAG